MALYFDSPQDLGRTLDNGFSIYRASLKSVLALSFLTAALVNLPSVFNYALVGLGLPHTPALTFLMGVGLPIVGFVLYMGGYVGLIFAQDAVARGAAPPTIGQALGHGFGRLGTTIVMMLALVVLIMVGFLLLIVPGVILSVSLSLGTYLVATENVGATDSLRRSHKLVWGQWWRTMIVITIAVLLYALPLMLVGGILGFVIAMGGAAAGVESVEERVASLTLAMVLVQIAAAGLLMPLMNGFMLAQLNDLKLRKSGADLLARAPA